MQTVLRWLAVLAAGALAALALIWITQRRFIYFPTQAIPDPAAVSSAIEEVALPTHDGLSLAAWLLPAAGGGDAGTVVVFNGNAGNRADRMPLAEALAEAGYSVLLVDYRGYGGNPGRPSEEGLTLDARAAAEYLSTRPGTDPGRLVYFGESLGAAVAIGLARHQEPAALVLRSPFTSLPDLGALHYPILPTSLLLWDRYPNLEAIRGVDAPVLVVAGSADSIVPLDQSREVFDAARGPKRLVVIEGADHNDYPLTSGPEMVRGVVSFLGEVMVPGDG